jgi:hypothetical protein
MYIYAKHRRCLRHPMLHVQLSAVPWLAAVTCRNALSVDYIWSESLTVFEGTCWCSWLRHCCTTREVAGSIPDEVIVIFHWLNPSGRTMALGFNPSSNKNEYQAYLRGVKAAGAWGWQPLPPSGSLSLLEPYWPVQSCIGIALALLLTVWRRCSNAELFRTYQHVPFLEYHLSSAVHDSVFNVFGASLHIWSCYFLWAVATFIPCVQKCPSLPSSETHSVIASDQISETHKSVILITLTLDFFVVDWSTECFWSISRHSRMPSCPLILI